MSNSNNFNLIAEAQNILSPLRDILEDVEFTKSSNSSGSSWTIDDESLSELVDRGLFYVTIRPDFYKSQKKLRLDDYQIIGDDGSVRTVSGGKFHGVGRRGKGYLKKLVEQIIERRTYHKIANQLPKSRWSIDIGFLNPDEVHSSPTGNDTVNIGVLLLCLFASGYDPLHILRNDSKISKWRSEMGDTIIKEANRILDGERQDIKRKLESLGKRIVNEVKYYIEGGVKPNLDKDTIVKRRSLQKKNPSLYPNGIDEPLSETEQLESFVWFRVNGENAWMNFYSTTKREMEKKKSKASAVVEKKWKEYVEPLEKLNNKQRRVSKHSPKNPDDIGEFDESNELEKEILRERMIEAEKSISISSTGEVLNKSIDTYRSKQIETARARLKSAALKVKDFLDRTGIKMRVQDLYGSDTYYSLSWSDKQIINSFFEAHRIYKSVSGGM